MSSTALGVRTPNEELVAKAARTEAGSPIAFEAGFSMSSAGTEDGDADGEHTRPPAGFTL
ncbi:hypothetical protein OHS70_02270 [Streptomyces sp. NBC_00390]|uniref:hypothetical protein n=1 Tax=Streptomyces sp. NBC_00390 TaxID=2975736 RepID=UPI002E2255FA